MWGKAIPESGTCCGEGPVTSCLAPCFRNSQKEFGWVNPRSIMHSSTSVEINTLNSNPEYPER